MPQTSSERDKPQKALPDDSSPPIKKLIKKGRERRESIYNLLTLVTVIAALIFLYKPAGKSTTRHYEENQIADRDIRAARTFTDIVDEEATLKKKQEALAEVLPVFDYEVNMYRDTAGRVASAFADARAKVYQIRALRTKGKNEEADKLEKELKDSFISAIGIKLTDEEYALFRRGRFGPLLQKTLTDMILNFPYKMVLASTKQITSDDHDKVVVRVFVDGKKTEEKLVAKDAFIDLQKAEKWFDTVDLRTSGLSMRARKVVISTAKKLIQPNTAFNMEETAKRKKDAIESVKPVTIAVKKGEIIVRRGDRIKKRHLVIIHGMEQAESYNSDIEILAGKGLLALLLMLSFHMFGIVFLKQYKPKDKDVRFLAGMLIATVAGAELFQSAMEMIREQNTWLDPEAAKFLFPAALAAMTVRLALNAQVTVMFCVVLAALVGLSFDADFGYTVYTLVSCLAGASFMTRIEQRSSLIKAAFKIVPVNVIMCLAVLLVNGRLLAPYLGTGVSGDFSPVQAVLFSIAAAIPIAIFLLPMSTFVDWLGYLTNIKLVELGNLNNPLLNKLAIVAPGTYHHSRVVAHLAEAAAERIGANPLLVTVMAYYHDIGKIKQPQYFTENQERGENKHDNLKPSMSKMIIASHVTNGIEIAKQAGLPKEIINAIPEHHGTCLMSYFYTKAKEQEDPNVDEVDESEYRYPGPKPQSKETAILMMADAIEATSKSLSDPTPAQLQGVIQKTINKLFLDGQFDECDLTLKDLHEVAKVFLKILASIYKPRIDYPSTPDDKKKKKKQNADTTPKQTKKDKDIAKTAATDGPKDLGRLGLGKD